MKKTLLISLFACVGAPAFCATLVEKIQADRLDESRREVVRPSEILTTLGRQAGAAERESAVLDRLSRHILANLSAQTRAEVKKQIESIIDDKDGAALDYFPTVDLDRIPMIQQALYLTAENRAAGPVAPPLTSVTFRLDGRCAKGAITHTPAVPQIYIRQTSEPIDQAVESCYAQNSVSLSDALNRLADAGPLTLFFDRAGRSRAVTVSSYSELLRALGAEGFGVEIFTKRTLVDFFGDTFAPPGEKPRDLRLVLWIRVPLPGGDFLTVPAEHGDFGMLLTRDGKNRFAESRYFIGVPAAGQTGVSFWRPRAVKNASWTESRLELVKGFSPARATEARDWLEASGAALRALRGIQKNYAFPGSAYGYYVCNDSVAVALAKYAKLSGTSQRLSHLFPLMRITQLEKDSVIRPLEAEFARALGVAPEFLTSLYPSDPTLTADLDRLKQRLEQAYPATDKARLRYFPEALAEFERKLW